MAPETTPTKHLTQQSIMLLLIPLILLQRQPVTCVHDRGHETPSGLPESLLASAQGAATAKALDMAQTSATSPSNANKEACEVFADYGKNYLTPVDVVVKNSDDNMACIKARFALSIKVEEAFRLAPQMANTDPAQTNETIRSILGYLPLEHVLSVEESCPTRKSRQIDGEKQGEEGPETGKNEAEKKKDQLLAADRDELEMIVTFNCAKLAFTFKRDASRIFVSSIRGIVKLDEKVIREFVAVGPMFVTSDLDHHFKYDDIIEVPSNAHSKTYILTANFYYTEIEAFRKTTSRDFVQPPDESSKPFSNEPRELPKQPPTNETPTKRDTKASSPPPKEVVAE